LKDQGVVLLGISVDKSGENHKNFLEAVQRHVPNFARSRDVCVRFLRHPTGTRRRAHHRARWPRGRKIVGASWTDEVHRLHGAVVIPAAAKHRLVATFGPNPVSE
jgi:hypothetical protein